MKVKKSGELMLLIVGLLLLLCGLGMILSDKVVIGMDLLTQQGSGYSGYLLLIIGLVTLLCYYYTLSPFGMVRKIFEGGGKITRKNQSNKETARSTK